MIFTQLTRKKAEDDYFIPAVKVGTSSTADGIQFRIKRDNGIDIPDFIKDLIMQPCFTTRSTIEGTGLGLLLRFGIDVIEHSGSISINSRVSQGAEFIINISI